MIKKIVLINQKGGVGKTTSTINIGAGLTQLKNRVMLIDLDPQAHLTYSLGIQSHELKNTIYEVLKCDATIGDVIQKKNGMDVIPSTLNLSGAEMELSGVAGREFILKESLEKIESDYDYILIDCPPNLGLLTVNALVSSNDVYIVLQTEFLALQGMGKLLETIEVVKKRLNKNLDVTGIIATMFDGRKKLNNEVVDKIKEFFPDKLFKTMIRDNIAIAEAPSHAQDIFSYKPDSYGAVDYMNLCKEIIKRGVK